MTRSTCLLALALATLAAPACEVGTSAESDAPEGSPTGTDGHHHEGSNVNPWDLVDRHAKEGPPRFSARVHGCPKMRVRTLGNVLASLGVDVGSTVPLSAGQLYRDGTSAMAGPNFANRIRENVAVTTSGSARLFDIFAAAADEIIAQLPTLARCRAGGVQAQLFAGNTCRADGISCLIGVTAKPTHVDLCNLALASASTPEVGRRLAVASLLAAAYTCE